MSFIIKKTSNKWNSQKGDESVTEGKIEQGKHDDESINVCNSLIILVSY